MTENTKTANCWRCSTNRARPCANGEKIALTTRTVNATSDALDFSVTEPFGGQDNSAGSVTASADGHEVTLYGNRWRALAQTFTVTSNTVLEFEYESDGRGEVQGIGFEEGEVFKRSD